MKKNFSHIERKNILTGLENEHYDVIIIGGGITGMGIALDCTTRGLKTLLVEMQDFAAGTSSRSTKLVHGGLRYLKQFELKMVSDVGKERAIVYENAPHITHPQWMLLPIYKKGTFGKYSTSIGLKIYDFLAGVKREEKRRMLSRKEVLRREPLLAKKGLIGGGEYVEYSTDDARLTIEVAKKAYEYGADLLNYAKVEQFEYDANGKVAGVHLLDEITEQRYLATGNMFVNAAGPWVERVINLDEEVPGKSLLLTKGVHIVLDRKKLPLNQPIYFDTPDGRMVFAIPRNGKTYVGTTDTIYEGNLEHPKTTDEDKEYLLRCIRTMFPETAIEIENIESTWAGIRPLIHEDGKGPSEISRKDEVWTSKTGLITIAGGKLTGYRKMAETVTDLLISKLDKKDVDSQTKKLKLSGGDFWDSNDYPKFIETKSMKLSALGMSKEDGDSIAAIYGTNTDAIIDLEKELLIELDLPLPIKLTLHYAIQFEMAMTPADYFARRTGAIYFDKTWVRTWKQPVIDYMDRLFNWSPERKKLMTEELESHIQEANR
ncbi:glycerol-3-phosphate dehydrogenase/oxidase [Sporosarcina jiandibaonis]|uniref:glycerol-3-phosphate dehydrogenase/oxidase n=1 Tax=Sporosarcina jiandibaonis TaxID=2715535 RepID=UPI0015563FBA|nr:FAD-dependent oxidoreductase [Sporosarcina jiandibaonis]